MGDNKTTEIMTEPMVGVANGDAGEGKQRTLGKRNRDGDTEQQPYKTQNGAPSPHLLPGPCPLPTALKAEDVVSCEMSGGDGGCTAVAVQHLGVWATRGEAVAALDAQIEPMHKELERRWGEICDESEAGLKGDKWHSEAIKRAVVANGWHFKKVRIERTDPKAVDLKTELKNGSYFVIGVTNNEWFKGTKKQPLKYPEFEADAPAVDNADWVHSIAIVNGRVLDHDVNESLASLWLGADNQPNPKKGYFRSIRKVWRISKCCNPGAGCRGACIDT
jgi:hypothetical protein